MPKSQKSTSQEHPPLRHEFIAKVRIALTKDGYQPEDFEISQAERSGDIALTIIYRFAPEFRFDAWVQTTEDITGGLPAGSMGATVVPGDLLHRENIRFTSDRTLLSGIARWVERMGAELKAIPLNRQVEEQARIIEELTAKFSQDAEGYYTREEAAELASRLDELEKKFEENIRKESATEEEFDERVAVLHQEISLLKTQLVSLPKKSWAKSAAIRAAKWLKDPENRKLLGAGADLAKRLFLPSGPGADAS